MLPNTSAQTETVKSLAISPDSRLVVSASSATITVWDIETCSSISVINGHQGVVNSVAYSPDGQHIVTGSDDKTAIIWEVSTGKKLHTLQHTDDVMVVNYSPNGQFIVTGTRDGILSIWNVSTGENIFRFASNERIWSAEFSPNGQLILFATGYEALVLNVATDEILYHVRNPRTVSLDYATFHPNGQLFATTGVDSALAYIWDAQTGTYLDQFGGVTHYLHLAYSPDGKFISSISMYVPINPEVDYYVNIIDTNTREFVFDYFYYDSINSSAFSPDNRYFVFNRYDEIKIYDTASWQAICSLK